MRCTCEQLFLQVHPGRLKRGINCTFWGRLKPPVRLKRGKYNGPPRRPTKRTMIFVGPTKRTTSNEEDDSLVSAMLFLNDVLYVVNL